jgi:VHL beta domain
MRLYALDREEAGMRSRGRVMSAAIGLLGLLALLALPADLPAAAAATSSPKVPGLLRQQDIPGGMQQVGVTTAGTGFSTQVIDATACTETPQAVNAVKTYVAASFAPPGAAQGAIALFEAAASFTNPQAAKAGFALISSNVSNGIACPTVGFVPPGSTTPLVTFKFGRVTFPKIAGGTSAYTISGVSTPGLPTTELVVLSKSNIVILGALGASAPSLADLKTIATRANKRLTALMPVPTTTSSTTTTTTAPKPLTVDPVASHCADEGKVVSPASSQAATITFSNQTTQTLKIYWLDYTGARKPYGEVAPGATTTQATFVGHYWMLADATDQCARIASIDGATFTMAVSG